MNGLKTSLTSRWWWLTSLLLLMLCHTTAAFAYLPVHGHKNSTASLSARDGTFYLRILPLGASITWGQGSSDGNGYRKHLRDQLRFDGWNVNMVGSRSGGTMNDRDVEGWPGYRVEQVDDRARTVVPLYKPNVVLINAGTNDATQDYYVSTTRDRMRAMIEYIFATVPNVCVVLSTLIPNTANPGNVAAINDQYRALASELQGQGRRLVLVDFGDGWMTTADLADTTHPNDYGYKKMAAKWHQALQQAEARGWLSAPADDVTFSDAAGGDTRCDKTSGSGNADPRGRTQVLKALSPRIIDDGPYRHSSQAMGRIHSGFHAGNDTAWFARLVNNGADRGGERDDWVFSQGEGAIYYRENLGGGVFGDKALVPTLGGTCKQRGIRWGDVNNDGLDDFICIGPEGNMYVHINDGGKPPKFRDVGLYKSAPGGYAQTNVRLGDIDGDGRLDYCVVAGNGDIYCWRNGGVGEKAAYWQDFGEGKPVFTGKGMGDIDGVRLVDINGDFRADWLWLDDAGRVTTYINQRGQTKGLIPYWDSVGVTHAGMGEAGARSQIRFARLYDSGRHDYVYIQCMTVVDGRCDYEVRAWKNTGGGGAHQKGDGARWCDMNGSGNDDYVFIDHNSKITIFQNVNTPPNTDSAGWYDRGVVLDLAGVPRKAIHLGDWNGDGFCDVIITDKTTGALDVIHTYYDKASDSYTFGPRTRVVQSGCTQGWGVGVFDLGMQFADIDGDRRVDYLCLEPNGQVTGWLNKPGGLQWMNQIKFSVDKDRANHRWADVNGDGRPDFMWIDKFNGNTDVWYNMGERQISGSSFWWDPKGKQYQGSSSGPNLHFPNLGGQGRADMTEVNPKTGQGWTWFNSCPPGGDDGPVVDPGLPGLPSGGGDGEGGGGGGGGSIPDDEKCSPDDMTYSSTRPSRNGEYMRWLLMEPEYAATTTREYITIVNLTPHPFILESTHQYQMDGWDWDSIPPGKSRQNMAEQTGRVDANPVDTNGEAYYRIGDTGKKFQVRATTHIPDTYPRRVVFDLTGMGKGQREYKVPEQETSVTLVITGSNDYGFITSLSFGPGNWMNALKEVIKDRPLRHVVMPGSHDSGMSKLTGAILTGATPSNTQTQGLSTYGQLRMGARWFDLRVQTVHQVAPKCCDDYEFWTTHISDERGAAPIGQSGEHLDEVVDNINKFTSENPGEVIILQFRYLIGIRKVPSLGPIYWETKQKDEFFDKLRKINNRCGNIPIIGSELALNEKVLADRTVGSLMSSNGGKGCVFIFLNTAHLSSIALEDRVARSDGIYDQRDLPWSDGWPNKEDTKAVAEFNVNRWAETRSNVLVSQWLSTPDILTSTFSYSVQAIAVLPTNPTLYWRGVPDMSPTTFPNVIMVDYIGQLLMNEQRWEELGAELYTLAIGLNLYMLSENCNISPRRSPLLPKRSANAFKEAPQPNNPLVSSWNGIIFANGTTIDNPPPTLHVGKPEILRNGTVFSNGTVLAEDIRNPEYEGPIHANLASH